MSKHSRSHRTNVLRTLRVPVLVHLVHRTVVLAPSSRGGSRRYAGWRVVPSSLPLARLCGGILNSRSVGVMTGEPTGIGATLNGRSGCSLRKEHRGTLDQDNRDRKSVV